MAPPYTVVKVVLLLITPPSNFISISARIPAEVEPQPALLASSSAALLILSASLVLAFATNALVRQTTALNPQGALVECSTSTSHALPLALMAPTKI